jgi:predicted TIM-barrel fold metal-dependent hydrolase
MIIDCHYHLEERLLKTDELLSRMDTSGVDRVALIASMVEPYSEPSPFLVGLLQFLLTHGTLRGIGKRLVANFNEQGDMKILGKVYKIDKDPDNGPVFNAVKKYPDRFSGWIFVNPRGKNNQVKEFEKWKDTSGAIGVKAHSFWHHYNPEELAPVAELLAKSGKPLLIHVGFGQEGDFYSLLKKAPQLKLILAHAGFPVYRETWEKIKDKKNVYVDLSQTTYEGESITRQVVEYLGVDRCLFGTDGPFGFHASDGKFDYGFIKRRIERLFHDKGVQRRLLGENFAEIASIKRD